MDDFLVWLLRIVGIGLIFAGFGHVWLPRRLGWSGDSHRGTGPLSDLVIRMHVLAIGLFLMATGVSTVVGARMLLDGAALSLALLGSAVIIFGLRWVAEIVWVSRALRAHRYAGTGWRLLHALALVVWPVITAIYLVTLVVGASR